MDFQTTVTSLSLAEPATESNESFFGQKAEVSANFRSAFICAMLKQLGLYYNLIPLSHIYKKIKIGEVESD